MQLAFGKGMAARLGHATDAGALPGRVTVGVVLGITSLTFVHAKWQAGWQEGLWPWLGLSQLLGFWAVALMAVSLVAGSRAKMVEGLFGGLDQAVTLHRRTGPAAIIVLIVHVLLLVPVQLDRGHSLADLFVPFWSPNTRAVDVMSFWGFVVLSALAYYQAMRYERWQWVHRGMGVVFIGFTLHFFTLPSSLDASAPLMVWTALLFLAATAAWVYRVALFRRFGPRYRYALKSVDERGADTFDLVMQPTSRRMVYDPGTFVFIGVEGHPSIPDELHPFSLSSSPAQRELRVSIRQAGDHTARLRTLAPGQAMNVYGPFGSFSPHWFTQHKRLVFIGAGIGITPFLGMLAFELTDNEFRRMWLYYVVPDEAHAPYHDEISQRYLEANSYIDYILWCSREQGRITAAAIAEEIYPLDDYAVMLCGPGPFVAAMTAQFKALGLPPDRLISEAFLFH